MPQKQVDAVGKDAQISQLLPRGTLGCAHARDVDRHQFRLDGLRTVHRIYVPIGIVGSDNGGAAVCGAFANLCSVRSAVSFAQWAPSLS